MITLNKEIKAFTVLENTLATFKMEVEINTTTNIDITVDRTNNNKVTATNKQGERIIVLPYLVIEAKKLANDNKPKIDLTKTNFDYHKYDKKQVLTNDENTNNEVETMENEKIICECLQCSHLNTVTPENTYEDNLGQYTVCVECEGSFDVDTNWETLDKYK